VSKWLNARMKGDSSPRQELFPTEDRANEALRRALDLHKRNGRTVTEKWDGPKLRYEVTDRDGGFVAVHWLSDTDDSTGP
jgi:hypothetical protein